MGAAVWRGMESSSFAFGTKPFRSTATLATAIRDREEEFCIAAEEENQALLVAEAGGTVVVIVGSGLQGPEATMLLTVEVGPRGLGCASQQLWELVFDFCDIVLQSKSNFGDAVEAADEKPLMLFTTLQANMPFLKHCSSTHNKS